MPVRSPRLCFAPIKKNGPLHAWQKLLNRRPGWTEVVRSSGLSIGSRTNTCRAILILPARPRFAFPAHGLTAEFYVEPIRGDLTQRGIFLYLSSDQVRFGPALENVPAIVFSEIMRDVDLFVGVTSVTNDPTWRDTGPQGHLGYWNQWSFGELSENAKTRRQVLERLLPRLAQSSQFSLKDKFLVVKGELRTYKIHLGSGNILMEPNDQYLCIVPDRSAPVSKGPQNLFLPL